jgi:adenosine deaminase
VINFKQLQACQEAAFRHAFAWPHAQGPASLLTGLLQTAPTTSLAASS